MIDALRILLAFAEGQILASVSNQCLAANVAIPKVSHMVIPRPVAALIAVRAGPLVVARNCKTLAELLSQRHLQRVEFGVLIIAVVADALCPAAHAGLDVGFVGLCGIVRISASCQRSAVIPLQQVAVRDSTAITRRKRNISLGYGINS